MKSQNVNMSCCEVDIMSMKSRNLNIFYCNVYGIDMPSSSELVAHGRNLEQIRRKIGADRLIYQDLGDLIASIQSCNPALDEFDTSCFSGQYVTGDVTPAYLELVDVARNDEAKSGQQSGLDLSDITDVQAQSA